MLDPRSAVSARRFEAVSLRTRTAPLSAVAAGEVRQAGGIERASQYNQISPPLCQR